MPPLFFRDNPINAVTTKFIRTSTNKIRCPIFSVAWTPDGRRLMTGASSGEFTLWNGLTFNFETILQVHVSVITFYSQLDDMSIVSSLTRQFSAFPFSFFHLQAHDAAIRYMVWNHNDTWMVSGDHNGYVKYWQSNMNNVKTFQAHKEAIRQMRYDSRRSRRRRNSRRQRRPLLGNFKQ